METLVDRCIAWQQLPCDHFNDSFIDWIAKSNYFQLSFLFRKHFYVDHYFRNYHK